MLLVAVGGLVSMVLIGLAFFRVDFAGGGVHFAARFDFQSWLQRLPSNLPWVLPFMVLAATAPALRAIVWGRTVPAPVPAWRQRYRALALGGLINNTVPGHLGIFAASWFLFRGTGTPLPAALSSLLLTKLLEFGALVTFTSALAVVAHLRGLHQVPAGPMLAIGFTALVVFTVVLVGARRWAPRLSRRLLAAGRLRRLAAGLDTVAHGLVAVGSPRRLLAGWLLAGGPVVVATMAYGMALWWMGVGPFLLGGGLLLGALTFAQLTPGLPTTVGIYYLVCTSAARALGVEDDRAATLAVLTHVATATTNVLVGLVAALLNHHRLRELFRFRGVMNAPVPSTPH